MVRGAPSGSFEVSTFIKQVDVAKGFAFEEGTIVANTFAFYTDERLHVVRSVNLLTGAVSRLRSASLRSYPFT